MTKVAASAGWFSNCHLEMWLTCLSCAWQRNSSFWRTFKNQCFYNGSEVCEMGRQGALLFFRAFIGRVSENHFLRKISLKDST